MKNKVYRKAYRKVESEITPYEYGLLSNKNPNPYTLGSEEYNEWNLGKSEQCPTCHGCRVFFDDTSTGFTCKACQGTGRKQIEK